jgi:hypothetical protein
MNRNGMLFLNATPLVGGPPMGARAVGLAGRTRKRLAQAPNGSVAEQLRTRGPILPIHVGLPAAMLASLREQGETPPAPEEIAALVDTGASITAIRNETASRLGLIQTGSVQVGGVIGTSTQPMFSAKLSFPDFGMEFDPIQLAGTPANFPGFDVLIGRNILCQLFMSYDGPKGRFSLVPGA